MKVAMNLWVALLVAVRASGQSTDWFPLEVGNRWEYRCVDQRPPGYICGIEGGGCFCDSGTVIDLAVTDTVRIGVSAIPGPRGSLTAWSPATITTCSPRLW